MAIAPEKLKEVIETGKWSREEILRMKDACSRSLGDPTRAEEAEALLQVIHESKIHETKAEYVFMGYCPGGDIENALDEEWISTGFCEFGYLDSQVQMDRFFAIVPGDILILKKRSEFGKSMEIHAWGTVTATGTRKNAKETKTGVQFPVGSPYLKVNWHRKEMLEVPLMGCNYTVNIKTYDALKKEMPDEFWMWLHNID